MLKTKLSDWSNWIIERTDKWYVKSKLPKVVKEFIFLIFVLFGTLLFDISELI